MVIKNCYVLIKSQYMAVLSTTYRMRKLLCIPRTCLPNGMYLVLLQELEGRSQGKSFENVP
jgi:hypothetical protein